MDLFNNREAHFWRNTFTRLALVITIVTIIVWFLPKDSGTQLQYDVGKPWMYGSFIAKFDFPIYKTEEAIKAEKDSILNRFEPYYNYNDSIGQAEIKKFDRDMGAEAKSQPDIQDGRDEHPRVFGEFQGHHQDGAPRERQDGTKHWRKGDL